jgi:hypothetical protein
MESIQSHITKSFKSTLPTIFTGVVRKVYTKIYAVDVEDLNSSKFLIRVPIASPYAGSSDGTTYGLINYPTEGDIAVVALLNGSSYDPIVIGFLYTQNMQPPIEDQDDYVYTHKSGATIKIKSDGAIELLAATGKTITFGEGTSYNEWLDSHKHMTSQGPSGIPMLPSPTAAEGVLVI